MSTPAPHRVSPRGRSIRRLAILSPLLALLLVALLLLTALRRPAWYQPRSIDYARLPADKQDAVNLLDAIGDHLNAHREIDITLDPDQLNRWIAARAEIWPDEALADLGPVDRPIVELLPGNRLRFAALVHARGLDFIASLVLHVSLESDSLRLTCERVRFGALPIPASWIDRRLDEALADAHEVRRGERPLDFLLPNEFIWRNGRRPFRIGQIEIQPTAARIRLEPLP